MKNFAILLTVLGLSTVPARAARTSRVIPSSNGNYHYAAQYGSREYSVAHPETAGHDTVQLTAAKIDASGSTVFLSIPEVQPVMQMRIKYNIKDAKGDRFAERLTIRLSGRTERTTSNRAKAQRRKELQQRWKRGDGLGVRDHTEGRSLHSMPS